MRGLNPRGMGWFSCHISIAFLNKIGYVLQSLNQDVQTPKQTHDRPFASVGIVDNKPLAPSIRRSCGRDDQSTPREFDLQDRVKSSERIHRDWREMVPPSSQPLPNLAIFFLSSAAIHRAIDRRFSRICGKVGRCRYYILRSAFGIYDGRRKADSLRCADSNYARLHAR